MTPPTHTKEEGVRPEYDKYCGDKDLWEKYTFGQVMYKGKPKGEPQKIWSIYRDEIGVTINFEHSSFPMCGKIENDSVKINNGYQCDEIILTPNQQ